MCQKTAREESEAVTGAAELGALGFRSRQAFVMKSSCIKIAVLCLSVATNVHHAAF